ncbi:nucleotidyltransferase domain-containing protein [Deinococcus maricopensis]|uniref:DNA polymerase beta domain protein region n=1 Tax=Deinococcus maricopensis (strain DSM 21211 / LMG 22137 / NRRL B-23946 / LB-34) TaxID=709986 RepID=E8U5P5_DEIML|nr:nucleotidyltransferase domain-containing protein [Deinococcus maricopensis]ADV66384.1 DNA polymerase beta domain protein region [Deinococcus maricopensis DSM 21211]
MNALLRTLTAALANERGTRAVLLVGSHARGDHDPYSDLDLQVLTDNEDAPHTQLSMHGDTLVTISRATPHAREAAFTDPTTAAWNILPLRTAQPLHDPDGVYATLRARAEAFTWASVVGAAHARMRERLTHSAEQALKILGGLTRPDPEKALFAAHGLAWAMAETSILAHGALIPTENRYLRTAHDAEPDPQWRAAFWDAFGFTPLNATGRARAALHLYTRALHLHGHHLTNDERRITAHVTRLAARSPRSGA